MMITRLEIIRQYGNTYGHGLSWASKKAEDRDEEYVTWLEEKVAELAGALQRCNDLKVPHLY